MVGLVISSIFLHVCASLSKNQSTNHLWRTDDCSAGGLVTAVAPVVIECKGLWIGWSGLYDLKKTERIPEANPDDKAPTAGLLSDQVCLTDRAQ